MFISRKRFLKNSLLTGSVLTLSKFQNELYAYGSEDSNLHRKDPFLYAENLGITLPIQKILMAAILAPNSHNSQPWKIKIESNSSFLLFADPTKQLPEIDPLNRQLFHSQGTFLELSKLAADALMYDANIELFPKGNPNGSRSTLSLRPIARFKISEKTECVHDFLFQGLPQRRTNRSVYGGSYLIQSEIDDLLNLIGSTKQKIKISLDPNEIKSLTPIIYDAFCMETNRYDSNELNRNWFRVTTEDIYSKRDGLTLEGNGLSGIKLWFVKKFIIDLSKEAWHNQSTVKAGNDLFLEQVESSKALVFFTTEKSDTERDWIETGMDFMRFSLACALRGFAFHTMNQSLEDYKESKIFQNKLKEKLGLGKQTSIQLLARLGKSSYQFSSPRKDLQEFLIG
ncbi:hypothetical protein P3G55_07870 [Leptospira sp. 96542]|nr:hypothetical protein [Leptospira sp. 96542]